MLTKEILRGVTTIATEQDRSCYHKLSPSVKVRCIEAVEGTWMSKVEVGKEYLVVAVSGNSLKLEHLPNMPLRDAHHPGDGWPMQAFELVV